MKYLKLFEKWERIDINEFKHHKEIVKDVFQDIIDEYDIYEFIPSASSDADVMCFYIGKKLEIITNFPEHKSDNNILSFEIFPNLSKTIKNYIVRNINFDGHIKRLESMGYLLSVKWVSDIGITTQENSRWVSIIIDYTNA